MTPADMAFDSETAENGDLIVTLPLALLAEDILVSLPEGWLYAVYAHEPDEDETYEVESYEIETYEVEAYGEAGGYTRVTITPLSDEADEGENAPPADEAGEDDADESENTPPADEANEDDADEDENAPPADETNEHDADEGPESAEVRIGGGCGIYCRDCHAAQSARGALGESVQAYIPIVPLSEITLEVVTTPAELATRIGQVPANTGNAYRIPINFPGNVATTGAGETFPEITMPTITGARHIILDSYTAANQTWDRNQTSGRHFTVSGGARLELRNVTLSREASWVTANTVSSGGVHVTGTNSRLLMTHANATISNNRGGASNIAGGGVNVRTGGGLIMSAGHIINNVNIDTAVRFGGGGVSLDGLWNSQGPTFFTMTGGRISGNFSYGHGGGVGMCCSITLTIDGDAQIYDNTAMLTGGGIHMGGMGDNRLTMRGGAIHSNTAQQHGGGVHTGSGSTTTHRNNFTMLGGAIYDNRANQNGGGVFVAGLWSPFTMHGGIIGGATPAAGNTAAQDGGGVSIAVTGATVHMTGGEIRSNEAATNGGGVFVNNADFIMRLPQAIASGDPRHGDPLFAVDGQPGVYAEPGYNDDNHVSPAIGHNIARFGNGVHLAGASAMEMHDDSRIHNNTYGEAHGDGGGVHVRDTSTLLMYDDSIIEENAVRNFGSNYTTGRGGGIFATDSAIVELRNNAIVRNNRAHVGGGINACYDSHADISMFDNTQVYGHNYSPEAVPNEFGNVHQSLSSIARGGGVFIGGTSGFTMNNNSRIHDNRAGMGAGIFVTANHSASTPDAGRRVRINDYSLIENNWAIGRDGQFTGTGGDIHVGGGICVRNQSRVDINDNARIRNNRANTGGGVSIDGGLLANHNIVTMNGNSQIYGHTLNSNGTVPTGTVGVDLVGLNNQFIMNNNSRLHSNRGAHGGIRIWAGFPLANPNFNMIMNHNSSVDHNIGTGGAGGIFLGVSGSLQINDHATIYNNRGPNGAGILTQAGNRVEMNGGSIRYNGNTGASPIAGIGAPTTANGGGVGNTGVFVMNGGVIERNIASQGGGINLQAQNHAAAYAHFTMNGGSINDNRAHNGGGINISGAYAIFNGGYVVDNTAFIPAAGGNLTHGHGGGIRLSVQIFTGDPPPTPRFPTMIFADLSTAHADYPGTINITGNEAARHGGGVYFAAGTWNTNDNTGPVNIEDNHAGTGITINAAGTITNPATVGNGGGIFQSAGTLTIDDNWTINGNTALTGDGGGVWLAAAASLNASDANFSGNTAGNPLTETGMGGAIFTMDHLYRNPLPLLGEYGNLNLTNVTFSGNTAHAGPYQPPVNALSLMPGTAFVDPVSAPYTHHPLNNNDINFLNNTTPLRFYKTDFGIYRDPAARRLLAGAVFELDRLNEQDQWVHQTLQSPSTSSLTEYIRLELTLGGTYRLREITAPGGYWLPWDPNATPAVENYWKIEVPDTGDLIITPMGGDWMDLLQFVKRPVPVPDPAGGPDSYVDFWHVGNIPYMDFSFYKMDTELENYLEGAEFELFLYTPQSDSGLHSAHVTQAGIDAGYWTLADTVTSDAAGFVLFENLLLATAGEVNIFHLREITPPADFRLPGGQWRILVSADTYAILPPILSVPYVQNRDMPDFVWDSEDAVWRVGNELAKVAFSFYKTRHYLYNDQNWDLPGWLDGIRLANAHFNLFRWVGQGLPADNVLATEGSADWELVNAAPAISQGPGGAAITFELTIGGLYHLVEVLAPDGFDLPWGQWRIMPIPNSAGTEVGFRIRAQSDTTIPAFVNILDGGAENPIDPTYDAHFGGVFYVGNRPTLILPLMGGMGRTMFIAGGLLTLLLGMGLLSHRVRRGKLALADGECAGSCADCAHGTKLGATKVFCLRRGVMPIDGGCAKFKGPSG